MSALLQPFVGYVPTTEFAHRVVGPPAALLTEDQRQAARLDPLSFRHVIGRGAGTSKEEAAEWLRTCVDDSVLELKGPAVFVYRLAFEDLVATGLVVDVSVAAYDDDRIKRHEQTRPRTERRMADHFSEVGINGNPVALAHLPHPDLDGHIEAHTRRDPDVSFVAADGYAHSLWTVEGDAAVELCGLFDDVLYITDGHHRMSASSLYAKEAGLTDLHVPCALFSTTELRLRGFGRCVKDPAIDIDEVTAQLRADHQLIEVSDVEARPTGRYEFGVQLGSNTYRLRLDHSNVPEHLPDSLDVNLLQDRILRPVFGIDDPTTDERLSFVPDRERKSRRAQCDAWFLPFPTPVDDVLAVADAGLVMPPKSTWFAPKLPSGLVVRLIGDSQT